MRACVRVRDTARVCVWGPTGGGSRVLSGEGRDDMRDRESATAQSMSTKE